MKLLDMNIDELKEYMVSIGQPQFRALQLFQGFAKGKTIDELSNIPKQLRQELNG